MRINEVLTIIGNYQNKSYRPSDAVHFLKNEGFSSNLSHSSTATPEIIASLKKKYDYSGEINDDEYRKCKNEPAPQQSIKSVKSKSGIGTVLKKDKQTMILVKQKKEPPKPEPIVVEKKIPPAPAAPEIVKPKPDTTVSTPKEIIPHEIKQETQASSQEHLKNIEEPQTTEKKTIDIQQQPSSPQVKTAPPQQRTADRPSSYTPAPQNHQHQQQQQYQQQPRHPQPPRRQDDNNVFDKSHIKQRIFGGMAAKPQPRQYQPQQPGVQPQKPHHPASLHQPGTPQQPAAPGAGKGKVDDKKQHVKTDKFTPPEQEAVGIDGKKKFHKRSLKEIDVAIETYSKRKNNKKSKLLKMMKKKRIAERLANQQERESASEKLIRITDPTTPQELAQKMRVPVSDIVKFLFSNGMFATVNHKIDAETAEMVVSEFGFEIEIESLYDDIEDEEDENEAEDICPRAPIVTIMGHVDHGKTTLLDVIRQSKVVDSESGGITQHIGAYKIVYKDKPIVFLDTPGHKAFTSMRSRGAKLTDIVILVVAADDGLMPQTIEAINHARAAKAPIIIAINKIDKHNINIERLKQQLAEKELLVEDWGGQILSSEISALKKENIDDLLEKILLQSELLELKGNPELKAVGSVVEAYMEKGLGPVMTVLVQNGTLRPGDPFVVGSYSGKVRVMYDENNVKLDEAGPSTPVKIIGCEGVPEAGDPFNAVDDEKTARDLRDDRIQKRKETEDKKIKRMTLENLFTKINQKDVTLLNVIIKGDVRGSVEAIHSSLTEIGNEKIKVNITHEDVGGITENDVSLAAASDAIILGFKVRPSSSAANLAKSEGVEIRLYDIIYKLLDDVKASMTGMLDNIIEETVTGTAEVKEVFKISKLGKIAGCTVISGKIVFPAYAKLVRDNIMLYNSKLYSLKHYKQDVKEVPGGQDCGIGFDNYEDIKPGDIIECYIKVEIKQEL